MSRINEDLPFDKASEDADKDHQIDGHENVIEWLDGNKIATVQLSGHRKLNNKVREWARDYPDEVQICGENDNGSIVAHIPAEYISLRRPTRRELSEDEKQKLRERLAKARASAQQAKE